MLEDETNCLKFYFGKQEINHFVSYVHQLVKKSLGKNLPLYLRNSSKIYQF